MEPAGSRIRISSWIGKAGPFSGLAEDVKRGLTKTPKELPSKYFYDERGSVLFQEISKLPEYYLPRAERAILKRIAESLVEDMRPTTLVEFGSGDSEKTHLLLDAMARAGLLELYIPIDLSEALLKKSAERLATDYPGLRIHGLIADFEEPFPLPPSEGPRLIIFLGSTIGNLPPDRAVAFLRMVADRLAPEDRFLLGTDLVKDVRILERAYNDSAGVTAAFNRNILSVINRYLKADFDPSRFEHLAFYNLEEKRIEMHLVAQEAHRVWIGGIDLAVTFEKGESIRTEISCKYTRSTVEAMLKEARLRLLRWETDEEGLFALSLTGVVG